MATLCTRARAIDNAMVSGSTGRPLVNTGMLVGNAAVKAIASLSKGCALRTDSGSVLMFSCLDVGAVRRPMGKHAMVGMGVTSSARALNRIMMATVNVGHRSRALACSTRAMKNGSIGSVGDIGVVGSLRNGDTNVVVAPGSAKTNNSSGVLFHNGGSVDNGGRPLMMMSKIPIVVGVAGSRMSDGCKNRQSNNSTVSAVGPSSVTRVALLGNTSTTTLCNTMTTGNTVVVAAGSTRSNGISIGMSDGAAVRDPVILPRFRAACKVDSGNAFD